MLSGSKDIEMKLSRNNVYETTLHHSYGGVDAAPSSPIPLSLSPNPRIEAAESSREPFSIPAR
jgi:hypothetical protein